MKLWTFLGGITPFLASDNKDNIQEQNLEKHNVTINQLPKIGELQMSTMKKQILTISISK